MPLVPNPGFELVDMSDHLPGLIYRPGLTSWKPTVSREINTEFATYEDYIQSLDEAQRGSSKMLESHWPPSASEAESLHLSRWFVSLRPSCSASCLFSHEYACPV